MSRPTIRIDLADLGLDGQWVEIYDPRFMSYRMAQELRRRQRDDGESDESQRRTLLDMISDWYIYDADSGTPIERPPSAEGIEGLPAIAIRAIGERMTAAAEAPLPKGSPISPKPG